MATPSLHDYRWVVSRDADAWLEQAAVEHGATVRLARRLRADLGESKTHLVLQQAELRECAREKFDQADRMFFLPTALQLATDAQIAGDKAARFRAVDSVADLCCGVGGDLIELGRRGSVVGVERDAITALLAESNCRVCGVPQAKVLEADVRDFDLGRCEAWHIDPDRRVGGRRTTKLEYSEPSLSELQRLLQRNGNASLKLAPATTAPSQWTDLAELEWIAARGECRQQVAWFGELANEPGTRCATLVEHGGTGHRLVGRGDEELPLADSIGRWVYEPHAAVLAAGLTAALAARCKLAAFAAKVPYLTSDELVHEPAVQQFHVTETMPFDVKQLRRRLRAQGVGRLEVKVRGVREDPQDVRKRLQLRGPRAAVLLVAPFHGKVVGVLAERPQN